MSNRPLTLTALALIAVHFAILVMHSAAHQTLPVKATQAQLAFIIPVIIVAPLIAGFILPKFKRVGTILLLTSMLGSLVFGVYYHFVADTIDHVGHVAQMQPAFWSQIFQISAYLLALSELVGTALGVRLLVSQRQSIKNYAAQ
jgi:hypothetical protein